MVARDVVPSDAVVVDVVQHGHARFRRAVDVELGVVRLALLFVAGRGPGVVAPPGRHLGRGGDLLARRRPEPAVHVLRLEVGPVLAALEVAEAARRPDEGHVVWGG